MSQETVGFDPTRQTGTGGSIEDSSPPQDNSSTAKQAADVASHAKDSGAAVAQTAADQAKSVAAEATRQTRNLIGEAQGQVSEQASVQHDKAKQGLRSLGDELRSMADNGGQSGLATELAHQASNRAHSAADWLDGRNPGDLLDEVRTYARRRPGAFLLGAVVAGVVAGRLTRGVVAAASDDDAAESTTRRRSTFGDVATPPAASSVTDDAALSTTPPSDVRDAPYATPGAVTADPYGPPTTTPEPYPAGDPLVPNTGYGTAEGGQHAAPYPATPVSGDPFATDPYAGNPYRGAPYSGDADPGQPGEGRS